MKMKYFFAASLILVALVTVFHLEKVVPLPRAFGGLICSGLAHFLPFEAKAAYAESCVAGLERKQDQIRYAVSDASVRLTELDHRIVALQQQRQESLTRIQALVDHNGDPDLISREVKRYEALQLELTRAHDWRQRFASTLESLQAAEGNASCNVTEIQHRLNTVKLDHELNDARELAAQLSPAPFSVRRTQASHCLNVLAKLEHNERVREELRQRYGQGAADSLQSSKNDPTQRAHDILQSNLEKAEDQR